MSTPTQGYLTTISYSDTPTPSGAASWTTFAHVQSIKPGKIDAKDIPATVIDSPDQFEVAIPGWASGADAEVKVQFEKSAQAALYGLFRTQKGFQIMFPDGTSPTSGSTLQWAGWIKGYANEIAEEGLVTADISIKVNSLPVFTSGT